MTALDLNQFERAFLREDDRYPWVIHVELDVDGRLCAAGITAAFRDAVRRHPMAGAVLTSGGWELAGPESLREVEVHALRDDVADAFRDRFISSPIDLRRGPVRVALLRMECGDRLMVAIHHAPIDGIGAVRFVATLISAYNGDPLPQDDVAVLRMLASPRRERYDSSATTRLRSRVRYRASRVHPTHQNDRVGFGVVSRGRTRSYAGHQLPVSQNDVAIAAAHLAIADWNNAWGQESAHIGVVVPVNIRPPGIWSEGVANLAAAWPTFSTATTRSDRAALVGEVSRQARPARLGLASAEFRSVLADLTARDAPPALWSRLLTAQSIVVSNIGDIARRLPTSMRGVTITKAMGSVPPGPAQGIGLVLLSVDDKSTVVARYRRDSFSAASASAFVAAFDEHLTGVRS